MVRGEILAAWLGDRRAPEALGMGKAGRVRHTASPHRDSGVWDSLLGQNTQSIFLEHQLSSEILEEKNHVSFLY